MPITVRTGLLAAVLAATALTGCDSPEPPPATPRPSTEVGGEQVVTTADFEARVRVVRWKDPSADVEPPYIVDVSVQVTRGSWEFTPERLRLIWADGSDHGPIADASERQGNGAWRVQYDHPAGVGFGNGARFVLVDSAGGVLATWTT